MSPVARYMRYTYLHIVFRATQTTYFEECCVLGREDLSFCTFWRIVLHEYNLRRQMFLSR
jgi:hypothetical protein